MARPLLVLMLFMMAPAAADPSLCETAARRAALDALVPENVLRAAALLGSGQQDRGALRPWPWTLRIDGRRYRFDRREDLVSALLRLFESEPTQIEIGCFGIPRLVSGAGLRRVDTLVDPFADARDVAGFLAGLRPDVDGWPQALAMHPGRGPIALAGDPLSDPGDDRPEALGAPPPGGLKFGFPGNGAAALFDRTARTAALRPEPGPAR